MHFHISIIDSNYLNYNFAITLFFVYDLWIERGLCRS